MDLDVAPTVPLSKRFQGSRPWAPLASVSSALKQSSKLEISRKIFQL